MVFVCNGGEPSGVSRRVTLGDSPGAYAARLAQPEN